MACKQTHPNIQHFFVDFGQLLVITDGRLEEQGHHAQNTGESGGQQLVFQRSL
jgi:hypothetical protein